MKKVSLLTVLLLYISVASAQTDGYAPGKGANIYYRVFGSGVPVLVINGGPGLNSNGFEELAKTLSAHNQVIIYDQRGTGKSTLPHADSTTITMDLMNDDIEALRTHLHIDKWIVLGHSFGGMMASYYASFHSDHIISMILSSSGGIDLGLLTYVDNNINAKLTKAQLDTVNYWNKKISAGDTSYFARIHRAKALANAYVVNKKFVPEIAERLTQSSGQINGLVWQDLQKIHFDCANKLASFTQPVLIIQGAQDIVSMKTAQRSHQVLKHSTVVLVEHSVHYGWLDNPDQYLGSVEKFLDRTQHG